MYAPYPENMMESIKKVEATRAERMATAVSYTHLRAHET